MRKSKTKRIKNSGVLLLGLSKIFFNIFQINKIKNVPSPEDRKNQLKMLFEAIQEFIIVLGESDQYKLYIPEFEEYLRDTEQLMINGFDQAKLNKLSNKIRPILYTHRDWEPPYYQDSDGLWKIPLWFEKLDKVHEKVIDLAFELRVIGRY